MSVIAKISSYFERSVVTLKFRKEYLNTMTYNTPVLLRIKYWTVWYIERYSMSTYTEVSNFQKQSGFLAHPVDAVALYDTSILLDSCGTGHSIFTEQRDKYDW